MKTIFITFITLFLHVSYADVSDIVDSVNPKKQICKAKPDYIGRDSDFSINCPESYPAEYLMFFLKGNGEFSQLAQAEFDDRTKVILFGFANRNYSLKFDNLGKIIELKDNMPEPDACYDYGVSKTKNQAVCTVKFRSAKPSGKCIQRAMQDPIATYSTKSANCGPLISAMHSCFINDENSEICKNTLHLASEKPNPNARPFPSSEDGIADLPDSGGGLKNMKPAIR